MNWFFKFLRSSIGQKLLMSLTGLFLISFLVIHLIGNLQLLKSDGGMAFNEYAYLMTHNPLIKLVSYGLYFFILLHAIQGISIWLKNRKARGNSKYQVKSKKTSSWASRNMAFLGSAVLIFLFIHMGDFWFAMKMGDVNYLSIDGYEDGVANLYEKVELSFGQLWIVVFYVLAMIGLAFHLLHGFWSSFQTLGLNHTKYSSLIHGVGKFIAVIIPLGFAIIPLYFYFLK